MTRQDLPPLAPEMRTWLERAASGPGPSPQEYTRLKARIDSTIGLGGGGGPGGGGSPQKALSIPRAGVVKAVIGAGAIGMTVATAWFVTRGAPDSKPSITPAAETRAVSAGSTQPIVTPIEVPMPPDEPVDLDVASPSEVGPSTMKVRKRSAAPAIAREPVAKQPAEDGVVPPITARGEPSTSPEVATKELARERKLLEAARRALASSAAPRAIELLDRHVAEFSDGQLREEREALMVQALVSVGNPLAASTRARAFRARYPRSIFRDLVDAVAPASPPPLTKEP